MPKPQKKPRISTPDRKLVFGQGAKALRVGLYARVSTHDQQTLPMQMAAMLDYAKTRRWAVVIEVQDVGSGATTRPKRENLIESARRREIDLVLVWRLKQLRKDGLSKRAIAKQLGVSRTSVIRLLRARSAPKA